MKKETKDSKTSFQSKKGKKNLKKTRETIPLEPILLNQVEQYTKGVKSLPYEHGKETYGVFSNPKNPFMVGILAADTDSINLDPEKTQNLFQQLENSYTYTVKFPQNISAHRKRKLSSLEKIPSTKKNDGKFININDFSNDYLKKDKLKEDKFKLQKYIKSFCNHFLERIKTNHDEISIIINEIIPLFVKHKIRIRFYEAFRQIITIEDLIITLEKICNDNELENFELFCSALFVFYSSKKF